MNALKIAGFAVIAGLTTSAPLSEVCACALAPRAGESVHIAEESALIIWDAATGTQHFIRRAQFDTKAQDFGFLVPTPTRPALSEVNDAVFGYLVNLTRPPVRAVVPQEVPKGLEPPKSAPPPAVVVLETATVAGLDAVVLAANDAQALNRWLRDHGYASSPALAEWFKPYIAAKWIMTAFKISKGKSRADRAVSSAVRMSFKAIRPYFPYREPASSSSAPRVLEVYFVSGERVDGRIGQSGKWPGLTLWAKPLASDSRKELLERAKLPATAMPATAWLTRFLDSSAQRPGSDEVYFSRSSNQTEYLDADRLEAELARKESAQRAAAYSIPIPGRATIRTEPIRTEPMVSRATTRTERERERDAHAMYQEAVAMEISGKVADAVRVYRRAARAGSGQAAKRLGDIFDRGVPGVARDYAQSLQWYQTARDLGVNVNVEAGKR